jgi:hypothetical protein
VEVSNSIHGRKLPHPDFPVQFLEENMARIERGDPMGMIRDPAKERPKAFYTFDGKFQEPDGPQHRG